MKMKIQFRIIAALSLVMTGFMAFASTPQAVNVIKFGDAKTLFVGDSKSATLYAYNIASSENATAQQG
jgi:hypothetical protein